MEVWDLYDSNGELLNKTHVRGEMLPDDGYHLVVHVWIKNNQGQFLISQRAKNRPTNPLKFECVGGSVFAGENSLQAALRETEEEVGVKLDEACGKIIYKKTRGIVNGEKYNDIMHVWLFDYNGEVDIRKATTNEVEQAMWLSVEEIIKLYEKREMSPSLEYFFDLEELFDLKQKMQNGKKIVKKSDKNKKKIKKLSKTSKYFEFYDDVKAGCHKVIDW